MNRIDSLFNIFSVIAVGKTEDEGKNIGSRLDKIEVDFIISVKFNRNRGSLRARPEGLTRFSLVIKREGVEKLRNLIVEDILEHMSGKFNTLVIVESKISSSKFLDNFQTASQHSGLST